jgi:hypothetical protein
MLLVEQLRFLHSCQDPSARKQIPLNLFNNEQLWPLLRIAMNASSTSSGLDATAGENDDDVRGTQVFKHIPYNEVSRFYHSEE